MKKLLLSALSLSCFASFGQWASTPMVSACDVTYAFGKALASEGLVVGTGGLQSSSDNGATWAASNTGVPSGGIIFGTSDATNLYAFRQNSVYVSTTGNNWSLMASTVASSLIIKSMTVLNGTVIAIASPNSPASFKVLQYTAGSWNVKSSPTNSCYSTCIRNLGGTLYAGTTASNVLKSTDGGVTWTGGLTGMPTENCNKYVTALANSGSTLYCGTYGNKLVRSTDNGSTWAMVLNLGDNNTFGIGMNDFYIYNPSTVFVASDSGFVYTTNGGNTWTRYNTGLSYANAEWNMQRVTVSGNYVIGGVKSLSGVGAKVMRLPLNSIGINAGIDELNGKYSDTKAYPNPTSGAVTIELSDVSSGNYSVKIYDVTGREILKTDMINGKAELNLENQSKGLYTYTISDKNEIVSRGKLIVK
jgi:photosystem II stability/assembly factor-like uncharacterized protein